MHFAVKWLYIVTHTDPTVSSTVSLSAMGCEIFISEYFTFLVRIQHSRLGGSEISLWLVSNPLS